MTRNPLALAALLIVLVAGIYFVIRPAPESETAGPARLYPDLDTAAVDAIVIEGKADRTELARGEGGWVVVTEDGFPAERKGVDRVLRELVHLSAGEIASKRAEKYERFEVDTANGVGVRVSAAGGEVAHFVIGKRGPDMTSTYVRDMARPEVFLHPNALTSFFDRGGNTWKEKEIFHIEMNDMETLTVTRGEERLVFAQRDGDWFVEEPAGYVKTGPLLVAMARVMTRLTAIDFPPEEERALAGFDEPEARVEAGMRDGSSHVLLIGAERDGAAGRLVRHGSDEVLYSVQSSRLTNFMRPTEELIKPAPEPEAADPEAADPDESAGQPAAPAASGAN
ncbi:MAG: DUF4340 domain-containing protein [Gemmatimonadetes bacterium]|nr:DUF4340 domain-containing protein [Gemmatimonadota bacterium]